MSTAFAINDIVESRINEQGLERGCHYLVFDIDRLCTPFGDFVTYWVAPYTKVGDKFVVKPDAKVVKVSNGHLVLTKIANTTTVKGF